MSDLVRPRTLPPLPEAGLDLINRSRPRVDRFARPGVTVKKKLREYVFFFAFIATFLFITYGPSLVQYMSTFRVQSTPLPHEQSSTYINYLAQKTQLPISQVRLFSSPLPYSVIRGWFGHNTLLLSQTLFDQFVLEEQYYILLREVGRSVRLHALRELLVGLSLISIAGSICVKLKIAQKPIRTRYVSAIVLACVFSVAMVQLSRMHEYEIEYFALEHMRQNQHVTPAIKKMQTISRAPESATVFSLLFSRQIPYETKLSLARIYTAPKKTIIRPSYTASPSPEP